MSKAKKVIGAILIILIAFVVIWRVFATINAKPVDPSLMDGRKASQEYLKQRKEYYLNKQNNGDG